MSEQLTVRTLIQLLQYLPPDTSIMGYVPDGVVSPFLDYPPMVVTYDKQKHELVITEDEYAEDYLNANSLEMHIQRELERWQELAEDDGYVSIPTPKGFTRIFSPQDPPDADTEILFIVRVQNDLWPPMYALKVGHYDDAPEHGPYYRTEGGEPYTRGIVRCWAYHPTDARTLAEVANYLLWLTEFERIRDEADE